MLKKFKDASKGFEKRRKAKWKQVKAGTLSKADYKKWVQNQLYGLKWYKGMLDNLAERATDADRKAVDEIVDALPEAFKDGRDRGTYEIEMGFGVDTSYTLTDDLKVEEAMKGDYIPEPKLNVAKDKRWNRQKISSAITMGFLQGEGIPEVAKRLRAVTDMDRNASIRNARTYMTSAANAGKMDAAMRGRVLGLDEVKTWLATPDVRTRHSHRMLDLETKELEDNFSNGLPRPAAMHPFKPAEVYNCRCTMWIHPRMVDVSNAYKWRNMDEKEYQEWRKAKPQKRTPRGEENE